MPIRERLYPTAATVVTTVAALYFGREVFLPIAIALLLTFALAVVSALKRAGLPRLPAKSGDFWRRQEDAAINVANLQLEGLMVAVASINNVLVHKGLVSIDDINDALRQTEASVNRRCAIIVGHVGF